MTEGTTERCCNWKGDIDNNRCNAPAEFIVWGKLNPPEALGPRCYDCAFDQIGPGALRPGAGYAVYHLPKPIPDQPELTREELKALVDLQEGYIHEPPDECEHGFSPPSRCPNEGCLDQHVASAWFKLRAALDGETP